MGGQGVLCAHELCVVGVGDLEVEWHGAATDYEERLVGLGNGEAAVGEGRFCLYVIAWDT